MSYEQQEKKPLPPVELSLKLMAWNIKEIADELKKFRQDFNTLFPCRATHEDVSDGF
jgi:hypothetical protein